MIHLKKSVHVSIFFFLSYKVCNDIVCIFGRDEVMVGELVEFKAGTIDTALIWNQRNVGVVLMGGDSLMIQ